VDSLYFISSWFISDFQNFDVNSLSLLEIIVSGISWFTKITRKNVYIRSLAFKASK
jgi:hypothetical protein